MPSVVIYNQLATPAQVKEFRISVDPTSFNGRPDVKIYTDTTNPTEQSVKDFITGKQLKYLKVSGNSVVDYTQGEKDTLDAATALALLLAQRGGAKDIFDSAVSDGKILKAVVLLLIDELNDLRKWSRDFKTETAAATNLSNFQARVATLPTLADRTAAQARTAIRTKIDNGDAD